MSLDNLASASNEKREQNKILLRSNFDKQVWVTVQSVVNATGYTANTIIKWAKEADIPLIQADGSPVVPLTDVNMPKWLRG